MDEDCILPLAEKQARKIKYSLDSSVPSLIIIMKRSHVSGCFWLGIPKDFSTSFMSKAKISMTLVDQKGEKYNVTYIAERTALSGGWKRFAEDHNLRMGDAVLFQLVNLKTFKVFIARENGVADTDGTEETDGDISLLELKAQAQESTRGDAEMPEDVMAKYYELCCTHNSFLHTNIRPGHNSNLVAGMIIETVEIVHGIRSCKLWDTFNGELTVWRHKLEAFEKLGMSVGFVFPRLNELQKLSKRAVRRLPYQKIYQERCNFVAYMFV